MKLGPQYKIARRLNAPIFEKTQTQKFALREDRRRRRTVNFKPHQKTDFGIQMLEKQRMRFSYGLSEKQLSRYVRQALKKSSEAGKRLFETLESRLDNVVYRAGFASTRRAARQLVSHGHISVNGARTTIPSFSVKAGDVIAINEKSRSKRIFSDLSERLKSFEMPPWLARSDRDWQVTIAGTSKMEWRPLVFNIDQVLDYYRR